MVEFAPKCDPNRTADQIVDILAMTAVGYKDFGGLIKALDRHAPITGYLTIKSLSTEDLPEDLRQMLNDDEMAIENICNALVGIKAPVRRVMDDDKKGYVINSGELMNELAEKKNKNSAMQENVAYKALDQYFKNTVAIKLGLIHKSDDKFTRARVLERCHPEYLDFMLFSKDSGVYTTTTL